MQTLRRRELRKKEGQEIWRNWDNLDSGNWTVEERDAEGECVVKDLVAEFMGKIRFLP